MRIEKFGMILALFCWGMIHKTVYAVRPFVTDDARISDYGQLEFEMWPDFNHESSGNSLGYNLMFGVSFTDYIQLITGSGVGQNLENNDMHVHELVVQPKILLWEAKANGMPGLAFVLGSVLPFRAKEIFRRNTGYFANGMTTTRLFHDWLLLHVNFGYIAATAGTAPAYEKLYWGVGMDLGIYQEEIRFIAEMFAGDPYEIIGPTLAHQIGMRYLHSDHVNLDFTFGWQAEVDDQRRETGATSWWTQVGIRLLFDVFTHDGKPGNPMGAPGLFR